MVCTLKYMHKYAEVYHRSKESEVSIKRAKIKNYNQRITTKQKWTRSIYTEVKGMANKKC